MKSLVMTCWEGMRQLTDKEKYKFREIIRFKKGQQAFGILMNKFRTKRTMVIKNETAFEGMSELIKFAFDEIWSSDV